METLDIHSKSFLIKWVNTNDNSVINWQIKPLKRSINFAIYRKNIDDEVVSSLNSEGLGRPESPKTRSDSTISVPNGGSRRRSKSNSSVLLNNINNSDLVLEKNYNKLLANELVKGKFYAEKGGVFAFIFDNSFSKTNSKKVLFNTTVIVNDLATNSSSSTDITSTKVPRSPSINSIPGNIKAPEFPVPTSNNIFRPKNGELLQSVLYKRKRKKHQGFTKRFFILNFKHGTLSYYLINSNKLRGTMPIKHSIITADSSKKEIIIDSGLETWELKCLNEKEFNVWVESFNFIKAENSKLNASNNDLEAIKESNTERNVVSSVTPTATSEDMKHLLCQLHKIKFELENLENDLVNENFLLPPNSNSLNLPTPSLGQHNNNSSTESFSSPILQPALDRRASIDNNGKLERRSSIWKRSFSNLSVNKKPSQSDLHNFNQPTSINPTTPISRSPVIFNDVGANSKLKKTMAYVNDMNKNLSELIEKYVSIERTTSTRPVLSRNESMLSAEMQEFFDAEDYLDATSTGVLLLDQNDDQGIDDLLDAKSENFEETNEELIESSTSDEESIVIAPPHSTREVKDEEDLYPLPHEPVSRRNDIAVFKHSPPSILSFVRKNVGKDLSSIAMPVTMNEPLTILQRYSEIIEYCSLIDNASEAPLENGERILRIATFAVSHLSSSRAKPRAARKPFNPLLGETFELVREDMGIRLVSEKVSHRPPIFAVFVESKDWELSFSLEPQQKFWGKSAEIVNKGSVSLTMKGTGEVYQWTQPTTLLKNIIAGEKYTEPSGHITITSSKGQKAVVEFKAGGLLSGRSEELTIKAFDKDAPLPYTVKGKWTESLSLITRTTEKSIWTVGKLLPNFANKFGLTEFACALNQITPIEKGQIPQTDSRHRPDMLKYETGDVDEAERLKLKLEEDQRIRRKELESSNQDHKPKWFKQTGDQEWSFIEGEGSYWSKRKERDWKGCLELW